MARRGAGPRLRWRRGQWSIMWTENGCTRERRTGQADREAAEGTFTDWLTARRERPLGQRRNEHYLIPYLLSDYQLEHGVHIAGTATMTYNVEALLPWWGEATVAEITKEACQSYTVYRRSLGRADNTIRRELSVLSAALGHAHASGRLRDRPKVWFPPQGPGKDRWLTRNEAARLLWAARRDGQGRRQPYLVLFILMGLYGGARPGAILSLRWEQIDLERERIHWNPIGRTQTNKRRSTTPIPHRLLTFLRAHAKNVDRIGAVFTRANGRSIASVKKSFAAAAREAGLVIDTGERDAAGRPIMKIDVTPHTLRHTCGTWQAQAGVPLWQIGGWLGHSVARTTDLYAHHHPDHMEASRRALDRGGRR